MTISVVCPNGHRISAGPKLAGKQVKCPKCAAPITVPAATTSTPVHQPTATIQPEAIEPPANIELGSTVLDLGEATDPLSNPSYGAAPTLPRVASRNFVPATPTLGTESTSAVATKTRAAPTIPLIAATVGGFLTGFTLISLIGWWLLSGESQPAVAKATAVTPTIQQPSMPPGPVHVAPLSATPVVQQPSAPTPPGPTPPSAPTVPTKATAPGTPKTPLDLVPIESDGRVMAYQLPGPTWALAYDEPTGRIALTHDEKGILIYDVAALEKGELSPVAVLPTPGLPSAVCCKVLEGRRLFLIAGKDSPKVTAVDAETLTEVGNVEVPNADFVDYLAGSLNPQDPFVYYSTQRYDFARDKKHPYDSNLLGRFNAATLQHDGHVGVHPDLGQNGVEDMAFSPDGELIYFRSNGGVRVGMWSPITNSNGRFLLNMIPSQLGMYGKSAVPDPFGESVVEAEYLCTPKLFGSFGIADFEPKAFFRTKPLAIGLSKNGIAIGSTNTFKTLHTVAWPGKWPPPSVKTSQDFRQRMNVVDAFDTRFFAAATDDEHQRAILALPETLVIVPLSRYERFTEKSMIVTNKLPSTVIVGREYSVGLDTEHPQASFALITDATNNNGKTFGKGVPRVLGAPPPVEARRQLTLYADVDANQKVIILRPFELLKTLPLPITIRIDDETMQIVSFDDFREMAKVERKVGAPHSVTAPVELVVPNAKPFIANLPVVKGRTFQWTPSHLQLGPQSIHMRTTAGDVVRDWYWDVMVELPTIQPPFHVTGVSQPHGDRAVAWGQIPPPTKHDNDKSPPRKGFLALIDVKDNNLLKHCEVPFPIMSAVCDATNIYAAFNMIPRGTNPAVVPTKIIRVSQEDLAIKHEIDLPNQCRKLEIIAGKYLATDTRDQSSRFTIPQLTPLPRDSINQTLFGGAARARNGWIVDGVVWDEPMKSRQLILFPSSLVRADRGDQPKVSVPEFGRIFLQPKGPDVCVFGRDDGLTNALTDRHPLKDLTAYFGIEDWQLLNVFPGADVLTIPTHGKVTVIRDPELLTPVSFFRFEERQSTLTLELGKPTTVKYTADGAVKYRLHLTFTSPVMYHNIDFPMDEGWTFNADSANGEFLVSIPRSEEITSAAMASVAAWLQLEKSAKKAVREKVSKKAVRDYVMAIGPAYEALTGSKLKGVPVVVYAVVTAETEGGFQKTGLFHCYLTEVPESGLAKFLTD